MPDVAIPVELPIYKIGGKYYFRDDRLKEYRNICNPNDKKPIDSVLETPTKEDSEKVFGKCDKSPCNLKIKGERDEFKERIKDIEESKTLSPVTKRALIAKEIVEHSKRREL